MSTIKKSSLTITCMLISTLVVFSQKVKTVDISNAGTQNNAPTISVAAPLNGVTPDVRPDFQGGQSALNLFISKNLKYPKDAIENDIQGVLIVQLKIAKDSTASFDKFVRKLGYGCEEEAQRLIKIMPKWNPAILNGKPLDFTYIMKVTFKLAD